MSDRFVILDPTVEPAPGGVTMAPRLDSLDGKVIGLLDNTKLNSDRFLELFQLALQRRYPTARFVTQRKASASRVASAEILDELVASCDAVVAAVGD